MANALDKKALTEVFIILNSLDMFSKLPVEFQKYITDNKDNEHSFKFNKDIPLLNQVDNPTTRNLITYIYIKYISNDNKEFFMKEIEDIIKEKE